MRSSNVLTMMPSGSDVASKAISFLTVLKNFLASAGWNSIFLNECVSKKRERKRADGYRMATQKEIESLKTQLCLCGQGIHRATECVCVTVWLNNGNGRQLLSLIVKQYQSRKARKHQFKRRQVDFCLNPQWDLKLSFYILERSWMSARFRWLVWFGWFCFHSSN